MQFCQAAHISCEVLRSKKLNLRFKIILHSRLFYISFKFIVRLEQKRGRSRKEFNRCALTLTELTERTKMNLEIRLGIC